jgi:hypothetical protein
MIVEPNWGAFSAKFDGKEERAFEWLCSLLFSKEHKQPIGPLRYFNQAGIEEDPITVGDEVIGWQAKFVDKLSDQTNTLKKAIDDAKTQNPSLTHIFFYLNVDFAPSSKRGNKEPQYKRDIEEHATSKCVSITWRTKSFFEKPFVCEENANISAYFFTAQKSTIDLIGELARHTEAVLELIRSEIASDGAVIKIDRSPLVQSLKAMLRNSAVVIVSGEAGVGKTAVVKDFYANLKGISPLFLFKAIEFNGLTNANQLLKDYGNFTLSDLIEEFSATEEKCIVIDSAEELSGIEHPEVFQEVLAAFRQANWRIILTTRLNYLEDLERTLIHIYGISFEPVNVRGFASEELTRLSHEFNFLLPTNARLRTLLQNPFYLNEYLRHHLEGRTEIGYAEFREAMWNARIAKTSNTRNNAHRKREQIFLEIARKRAVTGRFFVPIDGGDDVLPHLESDEIIGFDVTAGGYFIAHDIYAEWALDKILEREFLASPTYVEFYNAIGNTLPIRRAFRSWLSEKLNSDNGDAQRLIEATIDVIGISRHWKDEAIVAALLSPYADNFVRYVSQRLLALPDDSIESEVPGTNPTRSVTSTRYEDKLLTKVLFLLRIACKDIDQELLRAFGAQGNALSQLFAKPRGAGWRSVIAFINNNKEDFGLRYSHLVLPVLDEWNLYNKKGATTKHASQIALFYYHEMTKSDGHFPYGTSDETKEQVIRIIFNGSAEVVEELSAIFERVVVNNDVSRKGQFYELATTALSDISKTSVISRYLPREILSLAQLFWVYAPVPGTRGWDYDFRSDVDMEKYFDLTSNHREYYPASAHQTPIYALLNASPVETVDFIVALTNRAVEYFANTEFAKNEVEEVEIRLSDDGGVIKQYICHRIWTLYRGTQTAPALLESIHMALEKWLLHAAGTASPEILESWCIDLIKNSRSSSITALVLSAVLAEPSKLFNIARILFRTKELFFFDTARQQLDASAKTSYAICHDPSGFFRDERLKTCDDKHRNMALENLALNYQLFRDESVTEEVATKRQNVVWGILDRHYAELPDRAHEGDADKTWRLYLARMDRRKMSITTEQADDKVLLNFNPEIDPELRAYSEDGIARSADSMKYIPLKLWAHYRFDGDESKYKTYPQYEEGPKLVLTETKDIVGRMKTEIGEQGSFKLFYDGVPAYACAALIKYQIDKLSPDEKTFCRDTILSYAEKPFQENYRYQISDGVSAAIKTLPLVITIFPETTKQIKEILLYSLFDEHPIGMNQRFSDNAVSAVSEMWERNPKDANSLLLGYLSLKPKLEAIRKTAREKNVRNLYRLSETAVRGRFARGNATEIERVLANEVGYEQLPALPTIDKRTLATAFLMLPLGTKSEDHRRLAKEVCEILAKSLLVRHEDKGLEYTVRQEFIDKLAHFALACEKSELATYLLPILCQFNGARETADILSAFVSAEDRVHHYDQFWMIWELFYPSILKLVEGQGARLRSSNIVHTYLLAWPYWKSDAKEWRSLRIREKAFFRRVAEDMGGHPAVLYSLAKLLNEIGSGFVDDGIGWISGIIERTPDLSSKELEINTVYYLENLVRGYVLQSRYKVRTVPLVHHQILTILNFLLEKGSATAYLLREEIL